MFDKDLAYSLVCLINDNIETIQMGNALYIIPFHNPWQNLFESLDSFTSDFMDTRQQPDDQQRESFD